MLTQDQLTAIRTRLNYARNHTDDTLQMCQDILSLLTEVEHLQSHNKQMQAALAQLSDKEYWTSAPSVRYVESGEWPSPLDTRVHIWHGVSDPQQLAEQALTHNEQE